MPNTDENGRSPLHRAAAEGNAALVQRLLSNGEDVNLRDAYSQTPLILAAEKGHLEIVTLLAKHAATDVTIKDSFGRLPLHWASQRCDLDMAKVLLDRSQLCANAKTTGGDTPLMWCITSSLAGVSSAQRCAMASLLLDAGADVSLTNETDESALTLALAGQAAHHHGGYDDGDDLVKLLQDLVRRLQAEEDMREEQYAKELAVTAEEEKNKAASGGASMSNSGGDTSPTRGFTAVRNSAVKAAGRNFGLTAGTTKKKLRITLKKPGQP